MYTVFLDGSGSYDPNNDALGYNWTNNAGITLPNQTIPMPSYVAPVVEHGDEHMFILHVTDGTTISDPDTVIIIIEERLSVDKIQSPIEFSLKQNYPNPFNPVTSIGFGVPEPAHVTVMIYNILGQEVRELFRGHMQPGYQFMQWDGKDMYGTPGPSGMYIVVMQAGEFIDTKKVILLK